MTRFQRQTPPRGLSYYSPLILLFFLVGIFWAHLAACESSGQFLLSFLPAFLPVPLMYLSVRLQLAVHTLGPLLFGLLAEYRFSFLHLGHFYWDCTTGRLRCSYIRNSPPFWQCLMLPLRARPSRLCAALYDHSGSMLSLFSGLCFLPPAFFLPAGSLFWPVMWTLSGSGVILAVTNGVDQRAIFVFWNTSLLRRLIVRIKKALAFRRLSHQARKGLLSRRVDIYADQNGLLYALPTGLDRFLLPDQVLFSAIDDLSILSPPYSPQALEEFLLSALQRCYTKPCTPGPGPLEKHFGVSSWARATKDLRLVSLSWSSESGYSFTASVRDGPRKGYTSAADSDLHLGSTPQAGALAQTFFRALELSRC